MSGAGGEALETDETNETSEINETHGADETPIAVHARISDLCTEFHSLQNEILLEADPAQGNRLRQVAARLIELSESDLDQVLGELFLTDVWNYNYSKPLYIAASLVALIARCRAHDQAPSIEDDKREQLVLAALGFNLGLIEYEKQVYENQEEFSFEEKTKLREHYPQQSADRLKAIGLDQTVIQDTVRNHNVACDNPSQDALLLRTPFIYAGIAMPHSADSPQQSINNPSREFAQMYANQELDPVYGGLFLKINGIAPVGSIINLESCEKVMVIRGPEEDDIASSRVRMLTNRNGVQLTRPGEIYRFHDTPSKHRGLADHHQFAWSQFSPATMWEE